MDKKKLAKIYREISEEKISVVQALKEIDIFLETVKEALIKDKKVKFVKRGTFEVLEKKPRMISNPATRELMKIYPGKTVKFRISKNIK